MITLSSSLKKNNAILHSGLNLKNKNIKEVKRSKLLTTKTYRY